MKSKTDKHRVGEIGENVACRFLVKQGFKIVKRNYWKKWGEIDVVARKNNTLHFIEVKTVSCQNLDSVTHETDAYRPEDNVHPWKLKRLSRTIQTYLLEKAGDDVEWEFDVIAIYFDIVNKKARVRFLGDIVI